MPKSLCVSGVGGLRYQLGEQGLLANSEAFLAAVRAGTVRVEGKSNSGAANGCAAPPSGAASRQAESQAARQPERSAAASEQALPAAALRTGVSPADFVPDEAEHSSSSESEASESESEAGQALELEQLALEHKSRGGQLYKVPLSRACALLAALCCAPSCCNAPPAQYAPCHRVLRKSECHLDLSTTHAWAGTFQWQRSSSEDSNQADCSSGAAPCFCSLPVAVCL